MARTKLSYQFPRFFEAVITSSNSPELTKALRNLTRELEKLHTEIARILNMSVGELDWTDVSSLTNSWANVGGAFADAGYMKINSDIVMLKGAISGGTIGSAAFTLPTGYRPANTLKFPVDHNGNYGELTINNSGEVIPETTPSTAYYLDGVIFRADG